MSCLGAVLLPAFWGGCLIYSNWTCPISCPCAEGFKRYCLLGTLSVVKNELNIYLGYQLVRVNCGGFEKPEYMEQGVPKLLCHFHECVTTTGIEKFTQTIKMCTLGKCSICSSILSVCRSLTALE